MRTVLQVEEWKVACEQVLGLALALGIESPELLEALRGGDTDAALTALACLLLMLEGARRVLAPRGTSMLLADVTAARDVAQRTFELTVAAGGALPEPENPVCTLDG